MLSAESDAEDREQPPKYWFYLNP